MPTCFNKNLEPYKSLLNTYGEENMYFIGNLMETNQFKQWKGDDAIPEFQMTENGLALINNNGEQMVVDVYLDYNPRLPSESILSENTESLTEINPETEETIYDDFINEEKSYPVFLELENTYESPDVSQEFESFKDKSVNEKIEYFNKLRGDFEIKPIPFQSNKDYEVLRGNDFVTYIDKKTGVKNEIPNYVYNNWSKLALNEGKDSIERYVNKNSGMILNQRTTDAQSLKFLKTKTADKSKGRSKQFEIDAETGTHLHKIANNELIKAIRSNSKVKNLGINMPDIIEKETYTPDEFAKFYGSNSAKQAEIQDKIKSAVSEIGNRIAKNLIEKRKKDPSITATVLTEQFIMNPNASKGSTADVLVVFSDNTFSIYDYKFIGSLVSKTKNPDGTQKLSFNDISSHKEDSFNLQISDMKRTLKDIYGFDDSVETMIMPFARMQSFSKKGKSTVIHKIMTYKEAIELSGAGVKYDSNFMPVARMLSQNNDLNELLSRLYALRDKIKEQKKGSPDYYKLDAKDKILRGAVNSLLAEESMIPLLFTAHTLFTDIDENINDFTLTKAADTITQLEMYKLVVSSLNDLYNKKVANNNIDAESQRLFDNFGNAVEINLAKVRNKNIELLADVTSNIGVEITNKQGKLKTVNEIRFAQRYGGQMSDVKNPIFRAFSNMYLKAMSGVVLKTQKKAKKIKQLTKNLTFDDYQSLINETDKGLELKSKYNPDYYRKIKDAQSEKNEKNLKWLKENVIFDKEYYNQRYNAKKKQLQDIGLSAGSIIKEMNAFEEAHNLEKYDNAYFSSYIFKKEPPIEWQSDFYKELNNNPDLKAFYDYYYETMQDYGKIAREAGYENIYGNTIPKIHKNTIERAFTDIKGVPVGLVKDALESIKLRASDEDYGSIDESGNKIQRIPIFYTPDWDLDKDVISRDLGRSLLLFSENMEKYKVRKDLEPIAISMRYALQTQESFATNMFGAKQKNPITGEYQTVEGNYENIMAFDRMINRDIYGQDNMGAQLAFKAGSETFSGSKIALKINEWYRKAALNYNPIGSTVNAVSNIIQRNIASVEGYVLPGTINKATLLAAKNDEKYFQLTQFIQVNKDTRYIADQISKFAGNRDFLFNDMYASTGRPEEALGRSISIAIMMSTTFDKDGKIRLLKEGETSIFDRFTLNENGELLFDEKTLDGLEEDKLDTLSLENYNNLRNYTFKVMGVYNGKANPDDKQMYNSYLIGKIIGTYRSWMPNWIYSKVKDFDNHNYLGYDVGKYNALYQLYANNIAGLLSGMSKTNKDELLMYTLGHTKVNENIYDGLQELVRLTAVLGYSNFAKLANKNYQIDFDAKDKNGNLLYPSLNAYYQALKEEHPDLSKEEFNKIMSNKIISMSREIAYLASLIAGYTALAAAWEDDPEKKRMLKNAKLIYDKLFRELSFMYNPESFNELYKSPLPVARGLEMSLNSLKNTFDEARDAIIGEDSKRDVTPAFYFTMMHIPILRQFYTIWLEEASADGGKPKEGDYGVQFTKK